MALSVSIFPATYRHDSSILPVATIIDLASDMGFLQIEDWLYVKTSAGDSVLTFEPPNRSLPVTNVILKQCFDNLALWSLGVNSETTPTGFKRTGTSGYDGGAIYDVAPLDRDNCSIQVKTTSISNTVGISLQDNSGTIEHNYLVATVAHGIILGQNGQGSIYELGALVQKNGLFRYEAGDIAMIAVKDGICRYYLVKPDDTMVLLRTTRSKLTEDATAEILLYFTNSEVEDVCLFSNTQVATAYENIGVAYYDENRNPLYWQGREDQISHVGTGDVLEMADKTTRYTYASSKRKLRSLAANPKSFTRETYLQFLDFVYWHGEDREFIFVDIARRDASGNPIEFWAKFTGPFVDNTRNGCQFNHSQAITEVYRNDYIPRMIDDAPPTVILTGYTETVGSIEVTGTANDNVGITEVQFYLNGVAYGAPVTPVDGTITIQMLLSDFNAGINGIYAIGYDYAGNPGISNELTYLMTEGLSGGLNLDDALLMDGDAPLYFE